MGPVEVRGGTTRGLSLRLASLKPTEGPGPVARSQPSKGEAASPFAYFQQVSRSAEVSGIPATITFRTPNEFKLKVPHLSDAIGPPDSGTM